MHEMIVDTNAKIDDAIPLPLILACPATLMMALTTDNRNVTVEQVTRNVCLMLGQLGGERNPPGCIF
jgi:inosine-uridine nucleoside N-ribohydrolase